MVPETWAREACGEQAATMRKITLTSEMLRRIEQALDERKTERRAGPRPSNVERRRRPDRRATGAAPVNDAMSGAVAPDDALTGGISVPD